MWDRTPGSHCEVTRKSRNPFRVLPFFKPLVMMLDTTWMATSRMSAKNLPDREYRIQRLDKTPVLNGRFP